MEFILVLSFDFGVKHDLWIFIWVNLMTRVKNVIRKYFIPIKRENEKLHFTRKLSLL